ncbi:MAG: glycosyltransferase family 9 protein [Myxococcota bacterium]|nr:glycosyltransferase family 9 protein [Myxococcota bacterium]
MYATDCRHFTGYKPCRFSRPCTGCPHHDPVAAEVLLINLDALGDVLRTTAILRPIRRAWPGARITWLTRPRAAALLAEHPLIDRVLPLSAEAHIELSARRFDVLLNVDKSRTAGALAVSIAAADKRGFGVDERGNIVPLSSAADYLYATGLDDDLKFRINTKSEPQMLCEAFGLPWVGDAYTLHGIAPAGPRRTVGFNTGCSPLYSYKKLPLTTQAQAIRQLYAQTGEPVLLLGGPEDTARNAALAEMLGEACEPTPTTGGLRAGAAQVARCDVVVSGDSLGMHMAIALGCHVVVWFGVTCPQEILLYGRGIKLLAAVSCAPCWQRSCDNTPKCYDAVSPDWITDAVTDCLTARAAGTPIDEARGAVWRADGG